MPELALDRKITELLATYTDEVGFPIAEYGGTVRWLAEKTGTSTRDITAALYRLLAIGELRFAGRRGAEAYFLPKCHGETHHG